MEGSPAPGGAPSPDAEGHASAIGEQDLRPEFPGVVSHATSRARPAGPAVFLALQAVAIGQLVVAPVLAAARRAIQVPGRAVAVALVALGLVTLGLLALLGRR